MAEEVAVEQLPAGPVVAMTRDDAAALGREIGKAVGYRSTVIRLPSGDPAGRVWAVKAEHLVTAAGRLLRSPAEWQQFQTDMRREVRHVISTPGTTQAAPTAPQADPVVEERPMAPMNGATNGQAVAGVAQSAPFDFERWQKSTNMALQHVQADEERLRQALTALDEEIERRRAEIKQAIAARQHEAKVLSRALGVDPKGQAKTSSSARRPAKKARGAGPPSPAVQRLMAKIREYSATHISGFRVSAFHRETGTADGSMSYLALQQLVTAGELEKTEPGHYLPVLRPVAG